MNSNLCTLLESVLHLKDALMANNTLKTLNLQATGMLSECAIALAESLPELTTLNRLCLTKNDANLNPIKANQMHLGYQMNELGNKAKSFAVQFFQSIRSNPTSDKVRTPSHNSISSLSVDKKQPSPAEQATAALMAFVVSMRLNKSINALELFDISEMQQQPAYDAAADLLGELLSLCERNKRCQLSASANSQPEAPLPKLNDNDIMLLMDQSKLSVDLLDEMLSAATLKNDNASSEVMKVVH